MFWIGMIVGLVIGLIACFFGMVLNAMRLTGMSIDEIGDCGVLLVEAGQNRESTIIVYDDVRGELDRVVLKEA